MNDPVVIVGAVRTPIGAFLGQFAGMSAAQLGAEAIRAAVERAGVEPGSIDEVIFGTCLFAGQKQAPARQAALGAGLPLTTGCTTISKMCGSGMMAAMLCHDMILAGSAHVAVAGGMESMSRAPHLLPEARSGYRMGEGRILDHMFYDGLVDAEEGRLMGDFACTYAERHGYTREEQDRYAIASLERAQRACNDGSFAWEIASVCVPTRGKGQGADRVVDCDETPFMHNADKIPGLAPVFRPGGTVTAGNSSSISDGAAALVLMRTSTAHRLGLTPLARIVGHASHAGRMADFPGAPCCSISRLYEKTGWDTETVELFEINEAFAVVALAAMRELAIPHEKLNVHGGACALGHPVGASSARIIVTLLGALRQHGLRRGVASVCIGGGEATSIAIESMH